MWRSKLTLQRNKSVAHHWLSSIGSGLFWISITWFHWLYHWWPWTTHNSIHVKEGVRKGQFRYAGKPERSLKLAGKLTKLTSSQVQAPNPKRLKMRETAYILETLITETHPTVPQAFLHLNPSDVGPLDTGLFGNKSLKHLSKSVVYIT